MKIDVDVIMTIVEDTLVEIYNSEYDRLRNKFEEISVSTNVEDLDVHSLLDVVETELEIFNSEYDSLKREFNIYLNNL